MKNQLCYSAIAVQDYKVHYSFKKQISKKHLNAWGKFYQFVHQQKQIQKFLEAYFLVDGKPKVGDKIYFDTQPSKITINFIEENYVRSELEQKFYEMEKKLKIKEQEIKMAKLVKITKQMALDWGLTEDDPIVGKIVTWYTKKDSTKIINKHANEIYLQNELNHFKKNNKVN